MVEQYQKRRAGLSSFFVFLAAMLAGEALNTDYGGFGVVIILIFYLLYQYAAVKQAAFLMANFLSYGLSVQAYASFAAVPMLLYNGKRGPSMKYLFYVCYPFHLLALYLIKRAFLS